MAKTCHPDDLTFTAAGPLYRLAAEASQANILDQLGARLAQLEAMLVVVTGEGHRTFRNYAADVQGDYLWSCQMIAQECTDLAGRLTTQGIGGAK